MLFPHKMCLWPSKLPSLIFPRSNSCYLSRKDKCESSKGVFNWPYSGILNIKWNKIYKLVVLVFIVFQYLLVPVHIISRYFWIGHFLFFFFFCCGFKKYSVFTGYQIFVTGKILVFHRCLDNKLLLSYYILVHWKLKRSAEFSPKVPIHPCGPKSDSASPWTISAQFKPKQP